MGWDGKEGCSDRGDGGWGGEGIGIVGNGVLRVERDDMGLMEYGMAGRWYTSKATPRCGNSRPLRVGKSRRSVSSNVSSITAPSSFLKTHWIGKGQIDVLEKRDPSHLESSEGQIDVLEKEGT